MDYSANRVELEKDGYSILDYLYSDIEIGQIINCIDTVEKNGEPFLKIKDVFAIRQLLKVVPELEAYLFNQNLKRLISAIAGSDYFLTKAIYFDKPSESNWFVGYHQDLSISVDKKVDKQDYINWTNKKGSLGVQPPIEILEDTVTIRIHLDKTEKENGALKVIPKSHLNGIIRKESIDLGDKYEHICSLEKGGVMLMKPLTLHASGRTTNHKRRRVIHLEFCNHQLETPIDWLERIR